MRIAGVHRRAIWESVPGEAVAIIDQTQLPHAVATIELRDAGAAARAIQTMQVRGAPLIGVTAAYGLALALRDDPSDGNLANTAAVLGATRPTAVNLRWAIERMRAHVEALPRTARAGEAFAEARRIAEEDVAMNAAIGRHGLELIAQAHARAPDRPVRILTHCNAGWIATVDWGTALAPIYLAHDAGVPVEVWVDETRPRLQGALTAWELQEHGVPHRLIVDNAGGHIMQAGLVDLVLVGADRVAANGDVANKIGTYLKALAAADCGVPLHVCAPAPTFDWTLADGHAIPIEDRGPDEVLSVRGRDTAGQTAEIRIAPEGTQAANPGFDVTPARLVAGFITNRGRCAAEPAALKALFGRR